MFLALDLEYEIVGRRIWLIGAGVVDGDDYGPYLRQGRSGGRGQRAFRVSALRAIGVSL
jgi:hypothetical protein